MQTLREFIERNVSINDKEWALLNSFIKTHHYKKEDSINFKNNIWTNFIYINSGLIRSYIINEEGKEFTRQFHFNTKESSIGNLFAVDLTSLLSQTPSCRIFEVLEDSEVFIFSKQDLNKLFNSSEKWRKIGHIVTELSYVSMDTYYNNLLTKNTKSRYLELLQSMSELIKKVPQYHIASYLGITPVTLSRIKKEITETEKKQYKDL